MQIGDRFVVIGLRLQFADLRQREFVLALQDEEGPCNPAANFFSSPSSCCRAYRVAASDASMRIFAVSTDCTALRTSTSMFCINWRVCRSICRFVSSDLPSWAFAVRLRSGKLI